MIRKSIVLFIGLGLLVFTAYAGFNLDMQVAIKQRVEKLDDKVKNKSTPVVPIVKYPYDYEDVDDENDGLLIGSGEIIINPDTISEDSPRAKIIHRGDFIWQKITQTKYVHYADRIIDDINKVYKYDCSGFVHSIILQSALPEHADNLTYWKQKMHPEDYGVRAWTFYDYFRENVLKGTNTVGKNNYWEVFMSVDSLKKGDLIIVRYDNEWLDEWKNLGYPASTGHVMIVWEVGTPTNNEVEIQVYDCASSGHSTDTRNCNKRPIAEINEDSGKKSGIGFGRMKYKISTDGHRRLYAYKWSLNSKYWYNLRSGDEIDEPGIRYDRIKGIIFARPIKNQEK